MFHHLRDRFVAFAQQTMIRSIGILVGGTVIAHAITLLAMPVNTRLYTPEHFSVLTVFSSLVGILAVATCLRFDAAIVLPEDDADGANLFALAIAATATTALILAAIMMLLPASTFDLLNAPALMSYVWLLPPAVFISGSYLALQAWYVRSKQFGAISRSRAGQAATAAAAQISLGQAGIAPLGLIVGHVLNYGIGSLALFGGMLARDRRLLAQVTRRRMRVMFKTYDRFPRYSVWEGLANGLSNSAPLIIIAAMSAGPEAGYLALSLFVLQSPMALLGNAVAQVYLSAAPAAHREGRLGQYTADVYAGLVKAGAGPLLFAAIASPALFGLVFGEPWARSGVLVSWMAPWFFLQFLSSPICNALHVTGHQKTMMTFHLIGVVVRVGSVLVAGAIAEAYISEIWAISGWLFYAAYLATILVVVRVPQGTFVAALRGAASFTALGFAAGVLAVAAARMFDL